MSVDEDKINPRGRCLGEYLARDRANDVSQISGIYLQSENFAKLTQAPQYKALCLYANYQPTCRIFKSSICALSKSLRCYKCLAETRIANNAAKAQHIKISKKTNQNNCTQTVKNLVINYKDRDINQILLVQLKCRV